MSKRLTENKTFSLGTFKPTDHVVAALRDDASAGETAQALRDAGVAAIDIAQYGAEEVRSQLDAMADKASGAAGFGYEISLMGRLRELAAEGCGWLLVYSPKDETTTLVADTLKQHEARFAVKYHLLAVEDLV